MMVKTVIQAFNKFLKETVNLEKDITSSARSSRDWLMDKISEFPVKQIGFPKLYNDIDIHFGSFSRKTQIRELDDIDIMIGLSGEGSTYIEYTDRVEISVSSEATNLLKFCHDETSTLNSRKLINKFVSALQDVPSYANAELKRNQEAAVLKLLSYTWNFDIVPCFMTSENNIGKSFYLIPDGNGYWKKTDPRIDRKRVSTINQSHDGNILNVIRIMKYWNTKASMPTIPSYVLETMILDYYALVYRKASDYVDIEVPNILNYLYENIMNDVNDPKGIQGNINTLSYDEKEKIKIKANVDFIKAKDARQLEVDEDMKASIKLWGEIFGILFPKYE